MAISVSPSAFCISKREPSETVCENCSSAVFCCAPLSVSVLPAARISPPAMISAPSVSSPSSPPAAAERPSMTIVPPFITSEPFASMPSFTAQI